MSDELTIISETQGYISIIYLEGVLDISTINNLELTFESLLKENRNWILLNFSKLKYSTSAGIGILNRTRIKLHLRKGALKLCCLPAVLRDALRLSGMDKLFSIYQTQEEAIESFSKDLNKK